jgi:hypothetical protein
VQIHTLQTKEQKTAGLAEDNRLVKLHLQDQINLEELARQAKEIMAEPAHLAQGQAEEVDILAQGKLQAGLPAGLVGLDIHQLHPTLEEPIQ